MAKSIQVQQVNVTATLDDMDQAFHNRSLLVCSFCGRGVSLSAYSRNLCEKLSKQQELFCPFCLRHDLTSKNNRHTLILTFRCVFGYLYYNCYKNKKRSMFLSQIQDLIDAHENAGLTNPAFKYDRDSFLWFINFEKVGATGKKIPVDEVHKTIANILLCFNLAENIPHFRMSKFYEKYKEAVVDFYTKRLRPPDKKILQPTFLSCGVTDTKELPLEKTREFTPQEMKT